MPLCFRVHAQLFMLVNLFLYAKLCKGEKFVSAYSLAYKKWKLIHKAIIHKSINFCMLQICKGPKQYEEVQLGCFFSILVDTKSAPKVGRGIVALLTITNVDTMCVSILFCRPVFAQFSTSSVEQRLHVHFHFVGNFTFPLLCLAMKIVTSVWWIIID